MSEDLVKVEIYDSEFQAEHAKTVLEDKGIKAFVEEPDAGTFGFGLDVVDEFAIIVHRDNFESAKAILDELEEIEEGEPIPAWTCKCGEEVDEGFGVCWSCGAEYAGDE